MTGAVGLLGRRSLRAHRRAILGLALVIALAGGVALASLAAARRTSSAFPRYLAAAHASDVAFNVVGPQPAEGEFAPNPCAGCPNASAPVAVSGLRGVVADESYIGLEDMFVLVGDQDPNGIQPEVVGSIDGRFLDQDRLVVREGRLPRADRPDEIAINDQAAALLHLRVGTSVHLVVPDLSNPDLPPDQVPILARANAHVTAVGLFPEEVLSDDVDGAPRVLVTPALTAKLRDIAGTYVWQGVRLAPGTSVDETIRAFDARLPAGYGANVQRTDTQIARVQRSVRPLALALGAFGGAAALAAIGLGMLGAVRVVAASSPPSERTALVAMGLSRRDRALVAAGPAVVASLLGAVGALAVALALSPLGPVGPVRQVDPHLGVALDASVLLIGAGALLLLTGAAALATGARATRRGADEPLASRASWLVARLTAAGVGPAGVVGARHAFGPDGEQDGVPTRSMLASCTLSVIAVVAALTFGTSVRTLLRTPSSYGWSADLAVISGGGYDELHLADAPKAARVPGIRGLTVGGFATVGLGGHQVNALGIAPVEGPALVTVVDGRLPHSTHEVALAASTARDLHRSVGDQLAGPHGALHVVGIAALPAVGPQASSHPSLGQGALFTFEGLHAVDADAYPSIAFVRLDRGLDLQRSADRIRVAVARAMSESPPGYADVVTHLRPSEVIGLRPASRTAYGFAAVLGAAAVLALALTLSASARRRRRTYAVLGALGMDGRQLRRSVRWQLNLLVGATLAVGLPLGVAVGRVAWTAFAHLLGTAGGPRVPILGLVVVALGVVVLANALGAWPARTATRPHGALLRPE